MSEVEALDPKQRLLIERVASNRELFVKCIRILQPEYFDQPLDRVVEFIKDYFQKYSDVAAFDVIEAETGVNLRGRELDAEDFNYVCDELEAFCRQQAAMLAILEGVDRIEEGELSALEGLIRQALLVKLDNSLGTDLFEDPAERIRNTDIVKDHRKIGLDCIDKAIGHIGRGELGIICAVSGGGKSLQLGNIGYYLAKQKLDIMYITLELDEGLYSKRLDTIITNTEITSHLENADMIEEMLLERKERMGSMLIKYMPSGTTCSDIRSFLMEYVIQRGKAPDAILVDYLAGMGLEGMTHTVGANRFDVDKVLSEGLRQIMKDFNAYGFTAAQINRDGQDAYAGLLPSHIQGGMSTIQTSDWTIAMVQNQEDIDNNQFKTVEMKLRNSAKTGLMRTGYINPKTLRFSNDPSNQVVNTSEKRKLGASATSARGQPAKTKLREAKIDNDAAKTKVQAALGKFKRK